MHLPGSKTASVSLSLLGLAHTDSPGLGCPVSPAAATQAHELSRSIPVQPSHQHPALAGILVQTKFRMPTRTREAHGVNF